MLPITLIRPTILYTLHPLQECRQCQHITLHIHIYMYILLYKCHMHRHLQCIHWNTYKVLVVPGFLKCISLYTRENGQPVRLDITLNVYYMQFMYRLTARTTLLLFSVLLNDTSTYKKPAFCSHDNSIYTFRYKFCACSYNACKVALKTL